VVGAVRSVNTVIDALKVILAPALEEPRCVTSKSSIMNHLNDMANGLPSYVQ